MISASGSGDANCIWVTGTCGDAPSQTCPATHKNVALTEDQCENSGTQWFDFTNTQQAGDNTNCLWTEGVSIILEDNLITETKVESKDECRCSCKANAKAPAMNPPVHPPRDGVALNNFHRTGTPCGQSASSMSLGGRPPPFNKDFQSGSLTATALFSTQQSGGKCDPADGTSCGDEPDYDTIIRPAPNGPDLNFIPRQCGNNGANVCPEPYISATSQAVCESDATNCVWTPYTGSTAGQAPSQSSWEHIKYNLA
jgi:hypothetical protein